MGGVARILKDSGFFKHIKNVYATVVSEALEKYTVVFEVLRKYTVVFGGTGKICVMWFLRH